ncbi:MAG: hypothetical protein ACAF41_24250 [Leptolyngbya sp. BL-A-14]
MHSTNNEAWSTTTHLKRSQKEPLLPHRLNKSDTPGEAGGLMSVTAPRAGVLAGGFSVSR